MSEFLSFSYLQDRVLEWGDYQGILSHGTSKAQAEKTLEEAAELYAAISYGDIEGTKDGLGDVLVTIILQAELNHFDLKQCLLSVLNVIEGRNGTVVNGKFLKDKEES